MPLLTIDGKVCSFTPGQTIMQIANQEGVVVPQYCYHDGLSIVASCRICLAEVWLPNARNNNKLEPFMGGKLMPTCQTTAAEGMVVYTDSPKSVANQKAVMEYLLINHPLDCAVCDQAGECSLQDYSYEYGRGKSRFEEAKIKQPKKDLGPTMLLYSDRCIMCTRCVRFTREVTGTSELLVTGRGNREEIDVFPGKALDNELSGNVADLCPVGALLDKDFLFAQRVWFLKETPSIDGITASGDNITIHHNDGKVYRIKPRINMSVNKWWISDEVRYGWKFIHRADRLGSMVRKQFGMAVETDVQRACSDTVAGLRKAVAAGKKTAVIISPMLPSEEAYLLAKAAMAIDPDTFLAVGPIPVNGVDHHYPPGGDERKRFTVHAEKCPNSRGVRRVLEALSKTGSHNGYVASFEQVTSQLRSAEIGGVLVTGNYPSEWINADFIAALKGTFVAVIDTLPSALTARADVLMAGATFAEKAGTFTNAKGMIQAFEAAIAVKDGAIAEGQLAIGLLDAAGAALPANLGLYNAAMIRQHMAANVPELGAFVSEVHTPTAAVAQEADMEIVEI